MSTLRVNNIQSVTPTSPVTINDSLKVTGSSTFTGSVDILGTVGVQGNINLAGNLTTTGNSELGNFQTDQHKFTGSFITLSGSKGDAFVANGNGNISSKGKVDFGSTLGDDHGFTGSFEVTSSNHFKVTSVSASFIGLPKVSGATLNSSSHGLSPGELFTISGSQLFSADLVASGSVPDQITASLFVLMKA